MEAFTKISAIFLLSVAVQNGFSARTGMSCSMDKATMAKDFEKALMSCALHSVDFRLMEKIIENISHLEKLLTIKFVCEYQTDFAKLAYCMVGKYAQCLPEDVKPVVEPMLPNEARWEEIIKFACDNRKVLSDQCMTQESSKQFIDCYKGKLQENVATLTSAASSQNINPLLCSIQQWDKECMSTHAGSCSTNYVQSVNNLVSMILNHPTCTNVLGDNTKLGSALSSILLKGHPLLFQPQGPAQKRGPLRH